jgi:hypothetical protein
VLIFTNLLLLPVLLSYTGVSLKAASRSLKEEKEETRGKGLGSCGLFLDRFTTRPWALGAIGVPAALAVVGFAASLQLKIGDLDPGAPELRPDFALQPRQRLHHQQLRALLRPVRGHRETDTEGRLVPDADRRRPARGAGRQVPGVQTTACSPTRRARSRRDRSRAIRSG